MSIDRRALRAYSASGKSAVPGLQGVWQNELGSTMTITSFDGKTFGGTYASSVSSEGGPVAGILAGTLAGDALGFTVNWSPTFSSVTSWNGLLLTDGDTLVIYSLWQLASTPESEANYWESIQAGVDLFIQTTPRPRPDRCLRFASLSLNEMRGHLRFSVKSKRSCISTPKPRVSSTSLSGSGYAPYNS